MTTVSDQTIHRTPNPNCGACIAQRVHDNAEWAYFHPMAGHGFTPETGWTHADLLPAGAVMKHAAPVAGSTPVVVAGAVITTGGYAHSISQSPDKQAVMHSYDGGELLCRASSGFWAHERLAVTCQKCLEILNR